MYVLTGDTCSDFRLDYFVLRYIHQLVEATMKTRYKTITYFIHVRQLTIRTSEIFKHKCPIKIRQIVNVVDILC